MTEAILSANAEGSNVLEENFYETVIKVIRWEKGCRRKARGF